MQSPTFTQRAKTMLITLVAMMTTLGANITAAQAVPAPVAPGYAGSHAADTAGYGRN
ncbi:hypothetical protein [Nocardia transvalensis]|uniref:hypothetical protein n=1 Tax=Nocardia transvalensis TaxID=37333 RepID=UPI001E4CFE28|nr:hypothetical protein [Nocardia transvalensis]